MCFTFKVSLTNKALTFESILHPSKNPSYYPIIDQVKCCNFDNCKLTITLRKYVRDTGLLTKFPIWKNDQTYSSKVNYPNPYLHNLKVRNILSFK